MFTIAVQGSLTQVPQYRHQEAFQPAQVWLLEQVQLPQHLAQLLQLDVTSFLDLIWDVYIFLV